MMFTQIALIYFYCFFGIVNSTIFMDIGLKRPYVQVHEILSC